MLIATCTKPRNFASSYFSYMEFNVLNLLCHKFVLSTTHILLIIKEEGIEGGIFDIGSSDRFIHQINIYDELEKYFQSKRFLQPFNQWADDVRKHSK